MSTGAQSSSTTGQGFAFTLASTPDTILLAPGMSQGYVSLVVAPCSPAGGQIPCTLPTSGSESVSLNASVPAGISVRLVRSSVTLRTTGEASTEVGIAVAADVAPGGYSVSIQGMSGGFSTSYEFTVHVVQHLVFMISERFAPESLHVKAGSTVYWMNLDGPIGADPEIHDVVFTSGTHAQSPNLQRYGTYSFTFTAPGNYSYFCALHPIGMKAIIVVAP